MPRGIIPRHFQPPPPRDAIKARVEVLANVGHQVKPVTLSSDEKGSTVFTIDGVETRFNDEVLMDALQRVQQPDFEIIGMGPVPGGYVGGGLGGLPVPPGYRPNVERHEEVFEGVFEAGQEKPLFVPMQIIFRANRLEIDECDEDIIVRSIRVGANEQLTDDAFPLKLLADTDVPLALETASPGQHIAFKLQNRSKVTQKVKFRLVGDSIK